MRDPSNPLDHARIEAARYALQGAVPIDFDNVVRAWQRLDILTMLIDGEVRIQDFLARGYDPEEEALHREVSQFYRRVASHAQRHGGAFRIEIPTFLHLFHDTLPKYTTELVKSRCDLFKDETTGQPPNCVEKIFHQRHLLWHVDQIREELEGIAQAYSVAFFHYNVEPRKTTSLLNYGLDRLSLYLHTMTRSDFPHPERAAAFHRYGLDQTYTQELFKELYQMGLPGQFEAYFSALLILTNRQIVPAEYMDDFQFHLADLVACSEVSPREVPGYFKNLEVLDLSECWQAIKVQNLPWKRHGFSAN